MALFDFARSFNSLKFLFFFLYLVENRKRIASLLAYWVGKKRELKMAGVGRYYVLTYGKKRRYLHNKSCLFLLPLVVTEYWRKREENFAQIINVFPFFFMPG